LYPYENAFCCCEQNGWKYIFVLQENSLKSVQEEFNPDLAKKPETGILSAKRRPAMETAAGQILPEFLAYGLKTVAGDHLLPNSSSTPLIAFFYKIDKLMTFSILWLFLCDIMQEGKTLLFSVARHKEYEILITPGIAEIFMGLCICLNFYVYFPYKFCKIFLCGCV
jgi:hypothetical protein